MFLELKLEGYTTLEDILIRSMPFPIPKIPVKFYFLTVTYTKKKLIFYLSHSDLMRSLKFYIKFFSIEMHFCRFYSDLSSNNITSMSEASYS